MASRREKQNKPAKAGGAGSPIQPGSPTPTPSQAAKAGLRKSGAGQTRTPLGRKWLFRGIAVLSPLVLLVLLEVSLRLAGYGYPTGFFITERKDGRDFMTGNEKFSWRFLDPALARSPRPMYFPREKGTNTCRVFVLGESAAFGDPQPDFGLPRMLEVLLRDRYPGVEFQVINAAMTAINSHAILPIARDCAQLDGDVWVLYLGNNEVVGPFGAGTVFGPKVPSLPVIRAGLTLKATRTGQLLSALLRRATRRNQRDPEWGGMAMFLKNQVAQEDPRMQKVYRHFERNLADIIRTATRSGARVIVSSMISNLKDCAPFASLHRPGLSDAQVAEWERLYNAGSAAAKAGEMQAAVASFGKAAQVDDRFAALHFHLGRCFLGLGQQAEARKHFAVARDLDALRFRADSRINEIIRRISAEDSLVDAEAIAASESPGAITGRELLYEHVHLNFEGNYLLARALAGRIAEALPQKFASQAKPPTTGQGWLSREDCARRLAWTGWSRYETAQAVISRFVDPPFSSQPDAAEQVGRLRSEMEQLQSRLNPAGLKQALEAHQHALEADPNDWVLRKNLGRLQEQLGELTAAVDSWRKVTELIPFSYEAHLRLGLLLTRAGQHEEALKSLRQTLALKPDCVPALNGSGLALVAMKRPAGAMEKYSQALALMPDSSETHMNLGMALNALGKPEEAKEHFRLALGRKLNSPDAMITLGRMCMSQGWTSEAISNFTAAVRLNPADPTSHFCLAGASVAAGRLAEARTHFAEAVRLRPDYPEARVGLGIEFGRQGRHAEAMEQFSEAVKLKPTMLEARLNLGISLMQLGRKEEALQQFQEALRQDPNNRVARKYLQGAP